MQQGTTSRQPQSAPGAFLGRRRLGLTLAACLALVGLYALAGFVLVPHLVERYADPFFGSRGGAQLQLGEVSFNPFTLRMSVDDLELAAEDAAKPVLSVDAVVVDLAWSSLWRTGWRFSSLTLSGSHAQLEFLHDGSLNWTALWAPQTGGKQQPPPWWFGQVQLDSGRITWVDRRGDAPATAQVVGLELTLTDVSNLDREGSQPARYVFSAALDSGGTLQGEGSLALQPQVQSSGSLRLADIALAEPWPLLRRVLGLAIGPLADQLSANVQYRVAFTSGAPELQIDQGEFRLHNVVVQPASAETALLRLDTLVGSGGRLRLGERELSFSALQLQRGALSLGIDAQGEFDLGLLTASAASGPPDEPGSSDVAAGPWRLRIEALQVDDVALHLDDRSRQLALEAAALGAKASLSVAWGGGPLQLELNGVEARLDQPRLTSRVGAQNGGANAASLLAFDSLAASGGALHTAQRRIEAASINAVGGHAALDFGGEERVGLLQALRQPRQASEAETPPAAASSAAADLPWRYAVDSIQLEGLGLDIRHSGYNPPIEYAAQLTRVRLQQVDSAAGVPVQIEARIKLTDGGTAQLAGTLAQSAASGEGELRIDQFALQPLQPLLARYAEFQLREGRLSATLQLSLRRDAGAGVDLLASGDADVKALRIDELSSGERLLSWRSLHAAGLELNTLAGRLKIAEVTLQQPGAKLIIDEDRQVNLAQILRDDAPDADASAPAAPASQETPAFEVTVERLRIEDGVLDFADLSLVLPFSTQITELSGGIVNISTRVGERARVEAAGQIGSYGSARFSGSLLPFAPKQFLNIQAVMENVEIPPFSPYTATFAGRKVVEGRLWLDLDYRIEQRRLLGKNGIRLTDFKLGERVEAPRAFDAQLDMVVALLKDENGNIQLSIPITGDLGKPSVDVGSVLREAVGRVLQRIVSAPFRALARAFGGAEDGEDLARIEFAPGSDALAPSQREKLETVGRVLAQRPQLGLIVGGPYAPAVDAQALRRRAAREELARAVGNSPVAGTSPGPIAFESTRTQAALDAMLARYTGSDAQAASAPPGAVPAAGPYPAMFDRIVQHYPLPDSEFQLLAARRANAIRDYLVGEADAPVERVRTGQLYAVDADEQQVATTLEPVPSR